MKYATAKTSYGDMYGILLESCEDLWSYMNICSKEIELGVRAVLHSSEPVSRWDHLDLDANVFSSAFNMSWMTCKLTGGNPLMRLDEMLLKKYMAMSDVISKGEKLIVNKLGGWCPIGNSELIYDGEKPYTTLRNYYINKSGQTKFINLENDPIIEEYTRRELYKLDQNYSIIKNMIHWQNIDYIEVLAEFVKNGGQGIWVYTTGMNIDQMYMYTKAALAVGIKIFHFIFKTDKNSELNEFVQFLESQTEITELVVKYSD